MVALDTQRLLEGAVALLCELDARDAELSAEEVASILVRLGAAAEHASHAAFLLAGRLGDADRPSTYASAFDRAHAQAYVLAQSLRRQAAAFAQARTVLVERELPLDGAIALLVSGSDVAAGMFQDLHRLVEELAALKDSARQYFDRVFAQLETSGYWVRAAAEDRSEAGRRGVPLDDLDAALRDA